VEKSLRKRLRTCRKTDYAMNDTRNFYDEIPEVSHVQQSLELMRSRTGRRPRFLFYHHAWTGVKPADKPIQEVPGIPFLQQAYMQSECEAGHSLPSNVVPMNASVLLYYTSMLTCHIKYTVTTIIFSVFRTQGINKTKKVDKILSSNHLHASTNYQPVNTWLSQC